MPLVLLVLSVGNPPRMPTQNPNWFWKQSVWSTACLSAEADISTLGYASSAFTYMLVVSPEDIKLLMMLKMMLNLFLR